MNGVTSSQYSAITRSHITRRAEVHCDAPARSWATRPFGLSAISILGLLVASVTLLGGVVAAGNTALVASLFVAAAIAGASVGILLPSRAGWLVAAIGWSSASVHGLFACVVGGVTGTFCVPGMTRVGLGALVLSYLFSRDALSFFGLGPEDRVSLAAFVARVVIGVLSCLAVLAVLPALP